LLDQTDEYSGHHPEDIVDHVFMLTTKDRLIAYEYR
jgi:hypothetical protein